jgi:DNA-binding NarL/FixJ family response regulator
MKSLQTPIRVVLADDHSMVRQALARILEESGEISIVSQASNTTETVAAVNDLRPDVLVLDYSMPDKDAPQVIERLLRNPSGLKILVLTVHENIHYAIRVLESGAHGYLIKSAAVEELVEAIRTVQQGGLYVSPGMSQQVLQHLRRPKRERVGIEALSQREFDFLRLTGAGNSLQQCASAMNISSSTASTYRARIMEKLNLQSTAELIRFALENDIAG